MRGYREIGAGVWAARDGGRAAASRPATWLLDLDGTLVDSTGEIRRSWEAATAEILGRPVGAELIQAGMALPVDEHAAIIAPGRERELTAAYVRHYAPLVERSPLFPGVAEALARMQRAGLTLAVATSKRRITATPLVARLERHARFAAVVTADDVARRKPHPEPLQRALELVGGSPDRAAYLGDSPYDVRAARAAGVLAASAAWGAFAPEHLLAERPDIVACDAASLGAWAARAAA